MLAFDRLADDGLLVHVPVAPQSLLPAGDARSVLREVRRVAHEVSPDLVFVRSPQSFRWTAHSVRALLGELGSPPVVLRESDAWGGRKPLEERVVAWLAHADRVFSVAVGEQAALLQRHARTQVRYAPHVLPNQLLDAEGVSVPDIDLATVDVAHLGNCYVRFGLVERVDGARERLRVSRGLRSLPHCRVALYGHGWRGPSARGLVAFNQQIVVLRDARITVGWDHYQRYAGYFSNRLPIGMYSGRVHISSRSPGLGWLPGPDSGLHLVDTPAEAVDRVRQLLRRDPQELHAAGLRAHRWIRDRFTNLHVLLYMLGEDMALPAPPDDPWRAVCELDPCHSTV